MNPLELARLVRLRPRPSPPQSYDDFRRLARRRLPRVVYDFVEGGADGEVTLRANHAAFDRVHFTASSLVDVTRRDAGATVLGRRLEVPFILGPAGLARLVHRDGELAAARAAASTATVFVISTASSYSIEEIAAVSDGPLWFQLYLWRSPEMVAQLVDRAGAAGCEALVLTVDVPVIGKRERDLRNGMSVPPRIGPAQALEALRRPRWLWHLASGPPVHFGSLLDLVPPNTGLARMGTFLDRELADLSKTWDDVAWLRERWDGPLLIKGVMSAADARRCVEQGADAVVVSNHGGRQLDGLPAALDVLGEIVTEVGNEVEVILDGGIRRGADLVKARALGATATMGGRAWFWPLAAGGEQGVARMLQILRADVERTLALLGRNTYEELDASVLH
ncbi:MAG: alpha-hydroxy-acid oxidizing protein [Acidimicrobiia bacterium]|nr:alpha-hydroxy-acid oxidizing protein [Acidimicrobiia bacterium]